MHFEADGSGERVELVGTERDFGQLDNTAEGHGEATNAGREYIECALKSTSQ